MAATSSIGEIPKGMPQLGEVFAGKYRIERVLGAGGMGVVYAAMHIQLDELVALKLIRPECAQPEFLARFVREGRAAVKIRSEHVARVLDIGADERGISYLVMEHLEGHDLGDAAGALPLVTIVDYIVQACDALAHAHAMGIVHRDIKPSNLFAVSTVDGPCIKVLDFGIAKAPAVEAAGDDFVLTQTGGTMGSPLYMSPEQIRSTREVDQRADIWSLGVVLFELVAGKMPFDGHSLPALAASIVTDPPRSMSSFKPGVPARFEAVVGRCLEKRPEQRWSNVAELAQALAPFGTTKTAARADRVGRVVSSSSPRLPISTSVVTTGGEPVEQLGVTASAEGRMRETGGSWGGASPGGKRPRRASVMALLAGVVTVAGIALVVAVVRNNARAVQGASVASSAFPVTIASAVGSPSAAAPPAAPLSSVLAAPGASAREPSASTSAAPAATSGRAPPNIMPRPVASTPARASASALPVPAPPAPSSSSTLVRDRHGG